jgi:polyferredoxin
MEEIMEKIPARGPVSRRPKREKSLIKNGFKMRKAIQYGFLAVCVIIGVQFYLWYRHFATGGQSVYVPRPGGVEGFLPLSGLIGLKYWLTTGIFNTVHPSAIVILLAVLAVSLFFKKSFCSFICPVGLVSEWLWKLGRKLFGRKFVMPFGWRMPRWLDYPLRSLKYLLLLFFVNAILIGMNTLALKGFIESPYNKIADIKMMLFFLDISRFALGVIILLAVASLFIANFWCRYLCPYGGLLGILSFLSPVKIKRNAATCDSCMACTRVCPAMINVHKAGIVRSDECTSCLSCVKACPIDNTLYPAAYGRKKLSARSVAVGVLAIFVILWIGGRVTGYWKNDVSKQEYMYHIQRMDNLEYNHIR